MPGRLAATYVGTETKELERLLERGGVICGSSAGAIIQGSFIVRGIPGKPVLMARGHERGFGFLKKVAVDPHLRRPSGKVNWCRSSTSTRIYWGLD
jgi:cyanophycinase